MSRALELFCCHYLLSPCSGPSTSVSFRWRACHHYTRTHSCHCVTLVCCCCCCYFSMFTCSSGVSFLRNFPKNRVHDAASHSLSVLFTFQMFYSIPWCVGESFRFLHCSLICVWWWWCCRFLFLFLLLLYWCDPRGFVLHGLRKNLTNFECVYFLFPSKIVFFSVCFVFGSLCVSKNSKCNA